MTANPFGPRVLTAFAACIGAILGPAALAAAQSTPSTTSLSFTVSPTAALVAKGAAVDLAVTVTCDPSAGASMQSFELEQRVSGGRIARATGFLSAPLVCDGAQHVYTVRIVATTLAFKSGTAVTTASGFACTAEFCGPYLEQSTVRIR